MHKNENENDVLVILRDNQAISKGLQIAMKTIGHSATIQLGQKIYSLIQQAQKLSEWTVKSFRIREFFQNKNILQCLSHINFSMIKNLYLTRVSLYSIEELIKIQSPNLEKIDLTSNYLTDISSIRKIHSQKISAIYIYNNFLNQGNSIVQGNWSQISVIYLQFYEKFQIQQINFFVKLNNSRNNVKYFQLNISSPFRFVQNCLIQSINRKYQESFVSLQIYEDQQ